MDYQQSFENNPYSNILVNQLSPVSTGYIQTIPLYSNAVVPQLSLYNQNEVQLEPISYPNNSYLYTLQNTNYNPTNYLITPQQQELSYNTTDNSLRTSYPYSIPIYNMQPTSVLVNSGYAYNNINTQNMNTPSTTPLTIPVQIVPNYRASLLLQNGYVTNYNNPQLQNDIAYPNSFYLQNQQINVLPYETKSYEPEEANADTNNLISNYNVVNISEPVKQITSQTYENTVNTINYTDNISSNSVGSEFYSAASTANIEPEYQVQSMPFPNQPYQKLSLPPTVIIPKSNEDYTQIKKKRYAQRVKPLTKKREKVVIPAYEKYIPIKERVSIRQKGNDYIQAHNNISNIENKVISEQENNYIPYTENKYNSWQNNNYIPNTENIVNSDQINNYIPNTQNPVISEQNNNYIPNTENIVISEQNNNYIPSNETVVISEQNNNYYIPSKNLVIPEQNNNNIPNTENLVISGQNNNYTANNQNIVLSSQESNNIPNNQNIVISEQNNNYIPNNQNIVISEKESNYIPNNENFVIDEQESNYIPNNENIVLSDQNNNYLPNDENNAIPQRNNYYDNNAISGQKNIYVPKIEKVIISEQENNYLPNTTNNIISEQNNNFIPNIENNDITTEENNYLPTNNNDIISGGEIAYNHNLNKMKVENTVLPPRKSFIQKPLSFKIPKKLSRRLGYNPIGVKATSPLYFSGDSTANLAPLSPVRTPLEPSKEN